MNIRTQKLGDLVVLSEVRQNDVVPIAELFARARFRDDEPIIPGYITAAIAEGYFTNALNKYMEGYFGKSKALKATLDGKIVGFFMASPADQYPEIDRFTLENNCGELHWLYVEPDLKRNGIGTKMFQAAVQELCNLGYGRVVINMLRDKPATKSFYDTMHMNLLAERIEYNTRNGITFRVPCLLLGHHNLSQYLSQQDLSPIMPSKTQEQSMGVPAMLP